MVLADGRVDSNELGENFNITGMGRLETAQFLFHINRNILTPDSSYNDYYEASLLAADEWFDGDQAVIDNLKEAWGYVGLPTRTAGDLIDLSVDSDGFYSECGFGNYASTWVEISNVGTVDYTSDDATIMVTEGFGGTNLLMDLPLTEDILVGETLRINLDSLLAIDNRFIVINYNLVYPEDINPANDEEDDFISTTEFETNDISIALNATVVGCFTTEAVIEYVLINRSCESIDAGTAVSVTISNNDTGEEIYSEDIVTDQRILPNSRIPFFVEMDIQDLRSTELSVEVFYDQDPNATNNIDLADFSSIATSDTDYFNGFEDEAAVVTGLGLEKATFGSNVVEFDQEQYFWTTGVFDDSDDILCEDAAENFLGEVDFFSGISASLTACVDLSNEDLPTVNFNLVQFTNDDLEFASPLSSALEVSWGDAADESTYIYGQEEGRLVQHQIALPANFRGPLEFKFLTLTGDDDPQNLFGFDSQLLDNLNFGNATTSTDNPEASVIKLIPNPAHSTVFVASPEPVESVRVIDMNGRVVLVENRETQIDVSRLAAGFYRLEVLINMGQVFQESLIVVK